MIYDREHEVLVALARRNLGVYCYGWWRSSSTIPLTIHCQICGETIPPYKDDVEAHGIQHLKYSNLLPFL